MSRFDHRRLHGHRQAYSLWICIVFPLFHVVLNSRCLNFFLWATGLHCNEIHCQTQAQGDHQSGQRYHDETRFRYSLWCSKFSFSAPRGHVRSLKSSHPEKRDHSRCGSADARDVGLHGSHALTSREDFWFLPLLLIICSDLPKGNLINASQNRHLNTHTFKYTTRYLLRNKYSYKCENI